MGAWVGSTVQSGGKWDVLSLRKKKQLEREKGARYHVSPIHIPHSGKARTKMVFGT